MKPHNTEFAQYTVRWIDAHVYFHLNQAVYLRICFDALVDITRKGSFNTLKGDLARYWVKHFNCHYQMESRPGDVFDIHMWEDSENPMLLHVIIQKESKSIFQFSVEFTQNSEAQII